MLFIFSEDWDWDNLLPWRISTGIIDDVHKGEFSNNFFVIGYLFDGYFVVWVVFLLNFFVFIGRTFGGSQCFSFGHKNKFTKIVFFLILKSHPNNKTIIQPYQKNPSNFKSASFFKRQYFILVFITKASFVPLKAKTFKSADNLLLCG